VSEEITPANAVEIAKAKLDSIQWRDAYSDEIYDLVEALVTRVQELEIELNILPPAALGAEELPPETSST
jgi:hypothetical protein